MDKQFKLTKIRLVLLAILLCTAVFSMFACVKKNSANGILLSADKLNLQIYGSAVIRAQTDGAADSIVWSISDSNTAILKISEDKKSVEVVAVRAGAAVVSAKINKILSSCEITVTGSDEVPKITGVNGEIELIKHNTLKLKPQVQFANSTLPAAYEYQSDNAATASVDTDGVITANGIGSARITLKAEYYEFFDSLIIDVSVKSDVFIILSSEAVNLYLEPHEQLKDKDKFPTQKLITGEVFVGGEKQNDAQLEWSSLDSSTAQVESGLIKASNAGSTKIKAVYFAGGVEHYNTVDVVVAVFPKLSFSLSQQTVVLYDRAASQGYLTTAAVDAYLKLDGRIDTKAQITWSSNSSAVTVEEGVIKAVSKSAEPATVTAQTDYEGIKLSAEIIVTVKSALEFGEISELGKDGLAVRLISDHALYYSEEIDFSSKTLSDFFINMRVLPNTTGTRDAPALMVRLTDADDPSNYIVLRIFENADVNGYVVASVKSITIGSGWYKGNKINDAADTIRNYSSGTGYLYWKNLLTGSRLKSAGSEIAFSLDYGAKTLYGKYNHFMATKYFVEQGVAAKDVPAVLDTIKDGDIEPGKILNLSDATETANAGGVWSGFTNGKAKLSIFIGAASMGDFRFVVDKINGNAVTGADLGKFSIAAR